jgi:hypothetical protein
MLRVYDSCGDHFNTATVARKYLAAVNLAVIGSGRTGAGLTNASSGAWYFEPQLPATIANGFYCGMAISPPSVAAGFLFQTAGGMGLKINANGSVSVIDNTAAVVATSAASLVVANAFNYLTFYVTALSGTPTFSAYLNNSLTAICSGTSTHVDASVSVLKAGDVSGVWGGGVIDDFYLGDVVAGDGIVAPQGNVAVQLSMPNAPGAYSQFSITGGGTVNWQAVSQIPPPGNAAGVFATATNLQDAYNTAAPNNTPVVLGVQVVVDAKLQGSGTLQLEIGMGNGATFNYGSPYTPSSNYGMAIRTSALNPLTGLAWTQSDIAAFQPAIQSH